MSILDEKKPHQRFFEALTKIPHGSENEQAISDFLVEFAKTRKRKVIQDAANNVIVYKEASRGYEDHPAVMLQAHIDMVNEKSSDSTHNFETDPLDIYVEDGFVKARGTTLGADDGAGAAYIMAVLDDDTLMHPRINAVFTTGEESTMNGAFQIDPKLLDARRLINLDCIDEGISTTASSGGMDVLFHRKLNWINNNQNCCQLCVSGLYGGHSGGDIHLERGNALKIIARVLHVLQKQNTIMLSSLSGGFKVNAIPHTAETVFAYDGDFSHLSSIVKETAAAIQKELAYSDRGLQIEIRQIEPVKAVVDQNDSEAIVMLLYLHPTGLRHKSEHMDGLTVASENIGVVTLDRMHFEAAVSMRGALDSYVKDMQDESHTLGALLGFECEDANWYPCWEYVENSALRSIMKEVYHDMYGTDLIVEAVHGGLECGILKDKLPDLDIVTLGMDMYDVHTPMEKLDLASFDRSYRFLCEFLSKL